MTFSGALLAVPALAIGALVGSALLPHGGSAKAASCTAYTLIHDESYEGGVCCFTDHFHTWSGSGASRSEALQTAIDGWRTFTEVEYGSGYGHWTLAHSKSEKCTGGGGSWNCVVEARACRLPG